MRILKDNKILNALRCPCCKCEMRVENQSLVCNGIKKHCFDFGGGGYVNLGLPNQSGGGDSKEAVRARSSFLNLGYYAPVANKLADMVSIFTSSGEEIVIDAGCGEGYYSKKIAEKNFSVIGFDLSKFAADASAKRVNAANLDNAFFAVASVFSLPVKDACASVVTNVFAPCVEEEYSRVLKDNGVLIIVSAGQSHLMGFKRFIYDEARENTERADMPVNMEKIFEERLKYDICVEGNDAVNALFAMTPYYWKTSQKDKQKLNGVDRLETEIDMTFSVYRNNKATMERT